MAYFSNPQEFIAVKTSKGKKQIHLILIKV